MLPKMEDHDPRTGAILDQIKVAFAAKGFDGASMQDLARAAGMSAGNFYRYFPSKNAIVEAMITRDLDQIQADFARVLQADDARAALLAGLRQRIETRFDDKGPLWTEIEAAANRNHDVGEMAQRMQTEVSRLLIKVFARLAGIAEAEAEQRFQAHAALLIILIRGTAKQTCHFSGARLIEAPDDLPPLVMRMVEQLLDEIEGDRGGNARGSA